MNPADHRLKGWQGKEVIEIIKHHFLRLGSEQGIHRTPKMSQMKTWAGAKVAHAEAGIAKLEQGGG